LKEKSLAKGMPRDRLLSVTRMSGVLSILAALRVVPLLCAIAWRTATPRFAHAQTGEKRRADRRNRTVL